MRQIIVYLINSSLGIITFYRTSDKTFLSNVLKVEGRYDSVGSLSRIDLSSQNCLTL